MIYATNILKINLMTKYLQNYFYEKRGCLFGHPLRNLLSGVILGDGQWIFYFLI